MDDSRRIHLTPGPVSTLSLARPQALNALDKQALIEIKEALQTLENERDPDRRTRCLIVMGEGRAFAAGADVPAMRGMESRDARTTSLLGQETLTLLARFFAPSLALVHGFALGGGLELALACDILLCAQGTLLGLPEVTLGLVPGFGGTLRLPRRIGLQAALKLALSGERISAEEALRLGLVAEVVPPAELQVRGEELAARIASHSPEAVLALKRLLCDGQHLSAEAALQSERGAFAALMATPRAQDAIGAFLARTRR